MGAIKNYMMELADKLGKEFEELTQEDFENSLKQDKLFCDKVKDEVKDEDIKEA